MKNSIVVIGVFIGLFMISCASNKNKKAPTKDSAGLELPKQIDVGSVEVLLEFIELNDDKATVQVIEVLGYGSSTSRLAPNQSIEVSFHEMLTKRISIMDAGTEFEAVLAMQSAGMNSPSDWTITKILDR